MHKLVTTEREQDFLCHEETTIFIISVLLLQLRFSLINFTNLEFGFGSWTWVITGSETQKPAKTGARVATREKKERTPAREGQEVHFLPRTPLNAASYSWSACYADNENLETNKLHVQWCNEHNMSLGLISPFVPFSGFLKSTISIAII